MSTDGANIWDTLQRKVRGGPMALSIFVAGAAAFVIAIVFSYEDFMSSLNGIRSLEQAFAIQAVTADVVRYFMAVAPQVGQVVFIALWSLDTKRRWALAVGVMWFLLDFISDVQFRSAGGLFPVGGAPQADAPALIVSSTMTFIYFTIGAEMFLIAGSAIVITLFPDAVKQVALLWASFRRAIADAKKTINDANKPGGGNKPPQPPGKPQGRHQQGKPQGQHQQQGRPGGQPQPGARNGMPPGGAPQRDNRPQQGPPVLHYTVDDAEEQ